MASRQQSIQTLMAAEESAQQIVAAARKQKALKLKSSKEQAENEINNYKKIREVEYQKKLESRSGDVELNADKLNYQTKEKVDAIKIGIEKLKDEFVQML